MAMITDFLSTDMKKLVEDRVRERHLESPQAYIEALIEQDSKPEKISADLEARLQEAAKGPFIEVDAEYWKRQADELRAKYRSQAS